MNEYTSPDESDFFLEYILLSIPQHEKDIYVQIDWKYPI